jgi:PIN domain nuclease of toxin-antitoxin system
MLRSTAEDGLSLGNRFCLVLAIRDGLPVWTSDQNWKRVADAAKVKVTTFR